LEESRRKQADEMIFIVLVMAVLVLLLILQFFDTVVSPRYSLLKVYLTTGRDAFEKLGLNNTEGGLSSPLAI
jgi:hypothetical protein